MNSKICSTCEKSFDLDTAKFKMLGFLLCDSCYEKGEKPLGWPEHWEWTHTWPRRYTKNDFCMFCEEDVPDGHYFCQDCRNEIGNNSVYNIIGDIISEDDVNQLKRLCI